MQPIKKLSYAWVTSCFLFYFCGKGIRNFGRTDSLDMCSALVPTHTEQLLRTLKVAPRTLLHKWDFELLTYTMPGVYQGSPCHMN